MIEIIQQPYKYNWTRNPIRYQFLTDEDIKQDGFMFQVEVMYRYPPYEESFTSVIILELMPQDNKTAALDISTILDSLTEFHVPKLKGTEPENCEKQTLEFYINYRIIKDGKNNPDWETDQANPETPNYDDLRKFVLKGGMSKDKWEGPNYFLPVVNKEKNIPFLTWIKNSYVFPDQNVFLYLFCYKWSQIQKAHVELTYANKSTETIDIFQNHVMVTSFFDKTLCFPVGMDSLGIPAEKDGKKVVSYEVKFFWRYNGDGQWIISRFCVDHRHFSNRVIKQLSFRNSLGGLDSLPILGEVERSNNYTFSKQERINNTLTSENLYRNPERARVNSRESRSYKVNTGFLNKNALQDFRDAFLQKEAFIVKNERWIPIEVTSSEYKEGKNTDYLHAGEIEFSAAWDDVNYTPEEVEIEPLPTCGIPQNISYTEGERNIFDLSWDAVPNAKKYIVTVLFTYTQGLFVFSHEEKHKTSTNNIHLNLEWIPEGFDIYISVQTRCEFNFSEVSERKSLTS